MSNGLAIAATTAVFKNLLEDGLVQNSALSSMGNVLVTTLPPDQISIGVDGEPQLNLFLYQVSQNRNANLAGCDRSTYSSDRSLQVENPPLAINLHYLLTAYGNKDFQTEMLLGFVMQLMHQTPILSNDAIRAALNHVASTNRTGLLAQAIESASVADLAKQLGQVQITPNLFDTEQMSRLWSLLQSSYRPSIAYEVSMVFIGAQNSSIESVSSAQVLDQPRIEKVRASPSTNSEIIAGSSLIIYGKNLSGDVTRLRLNREEKLLEPEIVEENRILFKLPKNLCAGVQKVQVVHQQLYKYQNDYDLEVVSNEKLFTLHPTIQTSTEEKGCNSQEQISQEIGGENS
jgi:Pvc16 N-terminal domain